MATLLMLLAQEAARADEILVKLFDDRGINALEEIDRDIWIGAESGAYRIEGHRAVRAFDRAAVVSFGKVQKQVWLGTAKGIYRIQAGEPTPFLEDHFGALRISTILESSSGTVWIGTSEGAYRLEDGNPTLVTEKLPINIIREIDRQIWVGSVADAHRVTEEGTVEIFQYHRNVMEIKKLNSQIWFVSLKTTMQLYDYHRLADGGEPELILENFTLTTIPESVNGEIWFGTASRGVYRLEQGISQKIKIKGLDEVVNVIIPAEPEALIGTEERIYRREGLKYERMPQLARDLNIKQIEQIADQWWLASETAVYRLDQNTSIVARPGTYVSFRIPIIGINLMIGQNIRVKNIQYEKDGQDPYGDAVPRNFEVVLESDGVEYKEELEKLKERDFRSSAEQVWSTPAWFPVFYLAVRDEWGNLAEAEPARAIVIPWLVFFTLAVAPLAFFVVLLRAPKSEICMSIIMAPFSNFVYHILIATLLRVQPVTGRIVRYYCHRVEEEFYGWRKQNNQHAQDFLPELVKVKLEEHRKYMIIDKCNEGGKYLRFLTWHFASSYTADRLVPVFLHLQDSQDAAKLRELIFDRLSHLGLITNRRMAEFLLNQEKFLFLLYGLEDVNRETRQGVDLLLDSLWRNSRLILCSDDESDRGFSTLFTEDLHCLIDEPNDAPYDSTG